MWVPIVLAVVLGLLSYNYTRRPPNFPPGPWNLPIVGYYPVLHGRSYLAFVELSRKYGKIFSVNLGNHRAVVLCSYELLKEALKGSSLNGRPPHPYIQIRSQNKGILWSDGLNWQEMRRFAVQHLKDLGFGKTSLENVIQNEVLELIGTFKRDVGKATKLQNTFNLAVLNALWTITSGQRFDLEDPRAKWLVEGFSEAILEGSSARLALFIPLANKLKGLPQKTLDFFAKFRTLLKEIILEHKQSHNAQEMSDFIHMFLSRIEEDEKRGTPTPFTGEDGMVNLIVTTIDLFNAGSETTSSTLLWLFLLLAIHTDIQRKVQEELDAVVGRERLPSMSDKSNLPYTEAVLMECQRFVSLVPILLHSCTADTNLGGYDIPKGTIICCNLYSVMRDPEVWSKPNEFNPEHFLTPNGKVKYVEQLIPFGIGRRSCLGENLAKIELFLFAAALLQQFEFALPTNQPAPSLLGTPSTIIVPPPYDVILTSRF